MAKSAYQTICLILCLMVAVILYGLGSEMNYFQSVVHLGLWYHLKDLLMGNITKNLKGSLSP